MKKIEFILVSLLALIFINVNVNAQTNKYELSGDKTGSYQTLVEVFEAIKEDNKDNYKITLLEDDIVENNVQFINSNPNMKIEFTSNNQHTIKINNDKIDDLFIFNNVDIKFNNIILDANNITSLIGAKESNIVINDNTIIKNGAKAMMGAAINVSDNSTLTIEGNAQIINNSTEGNVSSGGAIYLEHSNFIMNGGTISGNQANIGGAIYCNVASNCIINNGNITNNQQINESSYGGGAIAVEGASKLTINGGVFSNNTSVGEGGAIVVSEDGSYETPGGPSQDLGSILVINNGEFYDNKSNSYGGVIAVSDTGNIEINNGKFHDNSAVYGGVISSRFANDESIVIDINGGSYYNNTANTGGALFVFSSENTQFLTEMNIQKNNNEILEFKNNLAYKGGAIAVLDQHTDNKKYVDMKMDDALIADNKVVDYYGGGIYLEGNVTLPISNTKIIGNQAISNNATETNLGGGIYLNNDNSIVNLSNTQLIDNSAFSGGGIYTANFKDYDNLTKDDYQNIISDANTVFEGNLADKAYNPPSIASDYTNIKYQSSSIMTRGYVNPINNYDINYIGKDPVVTYTITYDANGGQGAFDESIVADGEYTILSDQAASIVREGYKFIGWNTKADGSGTTYQADYVINNVNNDLILYAQWQEIEVNKITPQAPTLDKEVECEQDYQVIIPKQDGVDYQVIKDGNTIKVIATPKEGYEFEDGVTSEWTFDITNFEKCPVTPPVEPEKPGPTNPTNPLLPSTGSNTLLFAVGFIVSCLSFAIIGYVRVNK